MRCVRLDEECGQAVMPVRPVMPTGGIVNDPMTKKARELYVGNLPDGCRDKLLPLCPLLLPIFPLLLLLSLLAELTTVLFPVPVVLLSMHLHHLLPSLRH